MNRKQRRALAKSKSSLSVTSQQLIAYQRMLCDLRLTSFRIDERGRAILSFTEN